MDSIIKNIIVQLRTEKSISNSMIDQLINQLDEFKAIIKDQDHISRTFAGKLFYLFSTMVFEAKYMQYDQDIMDVISQLRVCVLKVFDEQQFQI